MVGRQATHAGTWYSKDRNALIKMLLEWFSHAPTVNNAKYLVSPHAGYRYSGPTACYAFNSLPEDAKRVFVLGPDHIGVRTGGTAHLSPYDSIETPIGKLEVDTEAIQALLHSGRVFSMNDPQDDLEEHSVELMMPYIAYRTAGKAKVVPMVITRGSLETLTLVAKAIKDMMKDGDFLVISSDFCHYGARFGFAPTFGKPADGDITDDVKALDQRAVAAMGTSTEALDKYFKETNNTICGHYPLLLATLIFPPSECAPQIMQYSCSTPRLTPRDSGVSYCAVVGVPK